MTLTEQNFQDAARELDCEVAAVKAVAAVESRGAGFGPDGRIILRFEAHWFHHFTGGRFAKSHPDISSPAWNPALNTGGQPGEHSRFNKALSLDRRSALLSASYGIFQIMGFNHAICGYPTADSFYESLTSGEAHHLKAFIGFVKSKGLSAALRSRDWARFALTYNGEGYAANRYDVKMKQAYIAAGGKA